MMCALRSITVFLQESAETQARRFEEGCEIVRMFLVSHGVDPSSVVLEPEERYYKQHLIWIYATPKDMQLRAGQEFVVFSLRHCRNEQERAVSAGWVLFHDAEKMLARLCDHRVWTLAKEN